MASRSVDSLVVGRVIGHVIDYFSPSVGLSVLYGTREVTNGCTIQPSAAAHPPVVQVGCDSAAASLYTLIMTDPDAPSPADPIMREWLLWMVVDIPGGSDVTRGKTVVDYLAPRPPVGIHRFVFILFEQNSGPLHSVVVAPPLRANFNTRGFAAQYGLGLPAAAVYFNGPRENKKLGNRNSSRN